MWSKTRRDGSGAVARNHRAADRAMAGVDAALDVPAAVSPRCSRTMIRAWQALAARVQRLEVVRTLLQGLRNVRLSPFRQEPAMT